jgi:hypothetical protein
LLTPEQQIARDLTSNARLRVDLFVQRLADTADARPILHVVHIARWVKTS